MLQHIITLYVPHSKRHHFLGKEERLINCTYISTFESFNDTPTVIATSDGACFSKNAVETLL